MWLEAFCRSSSFSTAGVVAVVLPWLVPPVVSSGIFGFSSLLFISPSFSTAIHFESLKSHQNDMIPIAT